MYPGEVTMQCDRVTELSYIYIQYTFICLYIYSIYLCEVTMRCDRVTELPSTYIQYTFICLLSIYMYILFI